MFELIRIRCNVLCKGHNFSFVTYKRELKYDLKKKKDKLHLLQGLGKILLDIDKAIRLGLNHPMGPFELNDYGGLGTVRDCLKTLYELTGDDRYRPVPALEELVQNGHLGRKTGKGWYDYN